MQTTRLPSNTPRRWKEYQRADFSFTRFARGARVLDVGCGEGGQLRQLHEGLCVAVGIELDSERAMNCARAGLAVIRANSEHLPIRDRRMDGVVCKVVLPYVDEEQTIREIARVLKHGGELRLSCHGLGYYASYISRGPGASVRWYGVRTILNTLLYRLGVARRWCRLSDSVYQSRARLARLYQAVGLRIIRDVSSPTFASAPVFIYQIVGLMGDAR